MTSTMEPPDEPAGGDTGELPPVPDNEPEYRDSGDKDLEPGEEYRGEHRFADEDEQEQIEHDSESEAEGE